MSGRTWTLRGGTIIDGTGSPPRYGNVVVEGDRIVAVGTTDVQGSVLNVQHLVVAPGFVDIHSHADWIAPLTEGAALLGPNMLQGITTTVAGNCGIAPAPLSNDTGMAAIERMPLAGSVTGGMAWNWRTVGEFFSALEQRGLPLNLCLYVGHSTLRATVMGAATRPPTHSELAAMQHLLAQGLEDGAVGLSIGLEYFPGRYAGTRELQALAGQLPAHDGLLAAHVRGISALYDPAITEAIAIADHARCRLQLAHVNPMGPANWSALDGLFERVDAARHRGLDVGYDIVTHVAWTITVLDLLPYPVQDLGVDAVLALAADDEGRAWLRQAVEDARPVWPPWIRQRVTRNIVLEMGWDQLLLAEPGCASFAAHQGQSLGEIAQIRQQDPYDLFFALLLDSGGGAQIVNVGYGGNFSDESPLHRLIKRADAIPETDTVPIVRPDGSVHLGLPMFYGTMARFLGHFSRDLGLVALPEAVQRITLLPAQRLRLRDRGILRTGAFADITVFDPETVNERGTHLQPQPAAGIVHVFVNGQPVVQDGTYNPERLPGHVLRRTR